MKLGGGKIQSVQSNVTIGGKIKSVQSNVTISVMKKKIGKSKHILDVLYVPGLTQNLLSVGLLIRKGYMVKFDGDYCWFKK